MTDRYAGLIVTLTDDLREDDAAPLIDAIRMMRGVGDVRPIKADITSRVVEEMRIRREVFEELADTAKRVLRGSDE